jgi:hypothetical protein
MRGQPSIRRGHHGSRRGDMRNPNLPALRIENERLFSLGMIVHSQSLSHGFDDER